jgi:hypothetical protein
MIVVDTSALLCAFLPDEAQPGAQALIGTMPCQRVARARPVRYESATAS